MATEAMRRGIAKYDAANTVQFKMKLNKKTDADILKRLEDMKGAEGGKQRYVKSLIRKDIKAAE